MIQAGGADIMSSWIPPLVSEGRESASSTSELEVGPRETIDIVYCPASGIPKNPGRPFGKVSKAPQVCGKAGIKL